MTCDRWQQRIDAYLDAEVPDAEAREFDAHLRTCSVCSAEALARSELKRSLHLAGRKFVPDPEFRKRVHSGIARQEPRRGWLWLAAAACMVWPCC